MLGEVGAEWWQVHHFNICQHALNSSNKKCAELGRQLSETMPLDISRRATPIFCTFSVALTHSHAQSKDAHPHTHTHTRTHGQTHTSTLSRTFATPNRTELNILPRKAKSVISSIYSTASCFFGLTFSAHSVLPCSLAQQKLKALKMPREWGSGYIDWMRWAGPRGLGYCTKLLGRRTFHAGG